MEINKKYKSVLEEIMDSIKRDSYVIACFTSKVEVGFCYYSVETQSLQFSFEIKQDDWNHILKIHVFNEEKEFRAVRRFHIPRDNCNGCLCIEKVEENKEYIEQKFMLIPNRWDFNTKKTIFLKTRNYISYNENGMVQTEDYKLVSLIYENGEEVWKNAK